MKINNKSKIVIMSDHHRGAGDSFDNFLNNKNLFNAALKEYYEKGFTYIELGDGDEMWEISNYDDIVKEHLETFKLLKKFYDSNRLIMFFGNHDIEKKNKKILKRYFYYYEEKELLNNISCYESLVIDYLDKELFLIHGHQVDFLNSRLWRLARFLVRHVWKFLERFFLKDPTSAAKNYLISKNVEKKLSLWSKQRRKIVIAGHTHRPAFPKDNESLYFNDGSGIHPNGVSAIEIKNGSIALVRWVYKIDFNNNIIVDRVIIEKFKKIKSFF